MTAENELIQLRRDKQQLQEQQQAASQALPEAVHMQVFDRLGPEIGAGDQQRLPSQLEKVERDNCDRNRRQASPLPGTQVVGPRESHQRTSPPFRK